MYVHVHIAMVLYLVFIISIKLICIYTHLDNDGSNNDGSDNDGSDNDGSENDGSENNGSDTKESNSSALDSLSTGVAVAITFAVTFILTLTATAIITFIITYFCVKRRFVNANPQYQSPQEKVLYEKVNSPSHTISEDDLELQPNPAYGTGHEVIKVTNVVYESCK